MDLETLYKVVIKTLMQLMKDPDSVTEMTLLELIEEMEKANGGDVNE